ncbi:unnamed protein product, partial [Meganyctiphanes norvegica]
MSVLSESTSRFTLTRSLVVMTSQLCNRNHKMSFIGGRQNDYHSYHVRVLLYKEEGGITGQHKNLYIRGRCSDRRPRYLARDELCDRRVRRRRQHLTDSITWKVEQEVQRDMEYIEEPPYFDASMFHIHTAFVGRSASLTCIVHDVHTDNSVSWIRDRDLRILTVGRYTYTTDLRFEALHNPGSSEWTMRIKTVQPRDEGKYECQIATKPIKTFNVFLKVV